MVPELEGALEKGENLVWHRLPRGGRLGGVVLVIRIFGHVLLTAMSATLAVSMPVSTGLQVGLGIFLCVATNAPLVVWSFHRWPAIRRRSGDSVLFVTNRRVGKLRPSGEIRQAPISAGLTLVKHASMIEFRIGNRTAVSFSGLTREEMLLVASVVEGMVQNKAK